MRIFPRKKNFHRLLGQTNINDNKVENIVNHNKNKIINKNYESKELISYNKSNNFQEKNNKIQKNLDHNSQNSVQKVIDEFKNELEIVESLSIDKKSKKSKSLNKKKEICEASKITNMENKTGWGFVFFCGVFFQT